MSHQIIPGFHLLNQNHDINCLTSAFRLTFPALVSGRYWANISDTLLTGEFNQWKEGELTVSSFKPGTYSLG